MTRYLGKLVAFAVTFGACLVRVLPGQLPHLGLRGRVCHCRQVHMRTRVRVCGTMHVDVSVSVRVHIYVTLCLSEFIQVVVLEVLRQLQVLVGRDLRQGNLVRR